MLNCFSCHHLAHICSAGRVANHSSASANKCNWLVARHLQTLHKAKRHKMTNMQTVGSRVKTNIKNCFSAVYQFSYFFFICNLCNKTSCNKLFINSHKIILQYKNKKSPLCLHTEDELTKSVVPPLFTVTKTASQSISILNAVTGKPDITY